MSRWKEKQRNRRGLATALAVAAGSLIATVIVKKRGEKKRPHVGLYFEDGSMVSLPGSSPQAEPLLELGREALQLSTTP